MFVIKASGVLSSDEYFHNYYKAGYESGNTGKLFWILRTIVYHLFQSIFYQRFGAKFTTCWQDEFQYFGAKFISYG